MNCRTCGFLAHYDVSNEAKEIPVPYRENPSRTFGGADMPFCLVDAYDLPKEIQALPSERPVSIETVIFEDRDCTEWTRYKAGSSPRDHRLMLDEQRERAREDQKWKWGVIRVGLLLAFTTVAGPMLAVVLDNCAFGGG